MNLPSIQFILFLIAKYQDAIISLFLIVTLSLMLHRTLIIIGQKWVETFAHTATLVMLPVVTYVLTSLISGDIALSLGMVGALSIVRFRNPVRSPFELTVYFISITSGVAASVDWKWLMLLVGSMIFICFFLAGLDYLSKRVRGRSFYVSSFTEGNHLSTIEVTLSDAGEILDFEDLLISIDNDDKQRVYVFASTDRKRVTEIYEAYNGNTGVMRLSMNL